MADNYDRVLFHAWYASTIDPRTSQDQGEAARDWWARIIRRYNPIDPSPEYQPFRGMLDP